MNKPTENAQELDRRLWDFCFGLLEEDESAALRARITSDPAVARAYARVAQATDRVAVASQLSHAPLRISASGSPAASLSTANGCCDETASCGDRAVESANRKSFEKIAPALTPISAASLDVAGNAPAPADAAASLPASETPAWARWTGPLTAAALAFWLLLAWQYPSSATPGDQNELVDSRTPTSLTAKSGSEVRREGLSAEKKPANTRLTSDGGEKAGTEESLGQTNRPAGLAATPATPSFPERLGEQDRPPADPATVASPVVPTPVIPATTPTPGETPPDGETPRAGVVMGRPAGSLPQPVEPLSRPAPSDTVQDSPVAPKGGEVDGLSTVAPKDRPATDMNYVDSLALREGSHHKILLRGVWLDGWTLEPKPRTATEFRLYALPATEAKRGVNAEPAPIVGTTTWGVAQGRMEFDAEAEAYPFVRVYSRSEDSAEAGKKSPEGTKYTERFAWVEGGPNDWYAHTFGLPFSGGGVPGAGVGGGDLPRGGGMPVVPTGTTGAGSKPQVDFYPEGGDRIAGLPQRIYFHSHNGNGEPIEIDGRLVDGTDRLIAEVKTDGGGRGWFRCANDAATRYRVRYQVEKQDYVADLAAAVSTPLTLEATQAVVTKDEPLRLKLAATEPNVPVRLVADCRGREVGNADFTTPALDASQAVMFSTLDVELPLQEETAGLVRVTAFDTRYDPPQPRAERLCYRHPAKRWNVEVEPQAEFAQLGEEFRVKIRTLDESRQPAPAALGIQVVQADDDFELTSGLMPYVYLFETDNQTWLRDVPATMLAGTPDADGALDLRLATDGWRRFVPARTDLAMLDDNLRPLSAMDKLGRGPGTDLPEASGGGVRSDPREASPRYTTPLVGSKPGSGGISGSGGFQESEGIESQKLGDSPRGGPEDLGGYGSRTEPTPTANDHDGTTNDFAPPPVGLQVELAERQKQECKDDCAFCAAGDSLETPDRREALTQFFGYASILVGAAILLLAGMVVWRERGLVPYWSPALGAGLVTVLVGFSWTGSMPFASESKQSFHGGVEVAEAKREKDVKVVQELDDLSLDDASSGTHRGLGRGDVAQKHGDDTAPQLGRAGNGPVPVYENFFDSEDETIAPSVYRQHYYGHNGRFLFGRESGKYGNGQQAPEGFRSGYVPLARWKYLDGRVKARTVEDLKALEDNLGEIRDLQPFPETTYNWDDSGKDATATPTNGVVYWNALVVSDAEGNAEVTFRLPRNGSRFFVRIDAHGGGRLGHAELAIEAKGK